MSKFIAMIADLINKLTEMLRGPVVTPKDATALPMPALESQGASFDIAAAYTLHDEGGYSNDPSDSGGPTNLGITQADLSEYLGRPASISEVKAITKPLANAIYKNKYWDVLHLDNCVDQNIAICIFDMCILMGTGKAAQFVQEICNVKVDYKIGSVTMAALNSMPRDAFINQFVGKCKERFNAIVAAKPSQSKFLNGWLARADRLLSFAAPDSAPVTSPPAPASGEIGAGLLDLAAAAKLNTARMLELINFQKKNNPSVDPRYWVLFNISWHSKNKRFALFDRVDKTVTLYYAAHGKNSDPDYDGLATIFSNVNGSNCSSLGIYKCAETYQMAGHGRALRLDGMSPTNSNARPRGVVLHGALGYVSDAFVAANGKCGRSLGCPAMDPTKAQDVIDKLKSGSLINAF